MKLALTFAAHPPTIKTKGERLQYNCIQPLLTNSNSKQSVSRESRDALAKGATEAPNSNSSVAQTHATLEAAYTFSGAPHSKSSARRYPVTPQLNFSETRKHKNATR